jgi:hypothetical protein
MANLINSFRSADDFENVRKPAMSLAKSAQDIRRVESKRQDVVLPE